MRTLLSHKEPISGENYKERLGRILKLYQLSKLLNLIQNNFWKSLSNFENYLN